MAGVDLDRYRFDYDLTFAALLMNANGTIYRTYGGRDWRDPQSHLSTASFSRALQSGKLDHAFHKRSAKPAKTRRAKKGQTIEEIPPMRKRIKQGNAPECFHCHMVNEARYEDLVARGKWARDDLWKWPDPIQIGVTLDRDDQRVIASVEPGSAADKAGLQKDDRLVDLDGRSVATFGDVQRLLHEATHKANRMQVNWTRGQYEKEHGGTLELGKGWKEATPLVFAWRASKWPLSPMPGFGGQQLKPEELTANGLAKDAFAFRIGYLVTWGKNARTGHNARSAGLRKGDIVVSVCGKDDFESVSHFHAWFRLTQKPGEKCAIVRIRNGKKETVQLRVID